MVKGFVNIIFLLFLIFPNCLKSQDLIITGVYQGRNIYVQNPVNREENRFCTREVIVNDQLSIKEPQNTAFEIDLSDLEPGTKVTIQIIHDEGCQPKLINPQVIRPRDTFRFVDFNISDSLISWSTEGDQAVLRYFIEKRLNSRWIIVKTAASTNDSSSHYTVGIEHGSGENQYRIKSILKNGDNIYSGIIKYVSHSRPITFYPERVSNKITLSKETDFQVLDINGNIMRKGKEKEISVENLSPGLYYLVIEDRTEKFIKK